MILIQMMYQIVSSSVLDGIRQCIKLYQLIYQMVSANILEYEPEQEDSGIRIFQVYIDLIPYRQKSSMQSSLSNLLTLLLYPPCRPPTSAYQINNYIKINCKIVFFYITRITYSITSIYRHKGFLIFRLIIVLGFKAFWSLFRKQVKTVFCRICSCFILFIILIFIYLICLKSPCITRLSRSSN